MSVKDRVRLRKFDTGATFSACLVNWKGTSVFQLPVRVFEFPTWKIIKCFPLVCIDRSVTLSSTAICHFSSISSTLSRKTIRLAKLWEFCVMCQSVREVANMNFFLFVCLGWMEIGSSPLTRDSHRRQPVFAKKSETSPTNCTHVGSNTSTRQDRRAGQATSRSRACGGRTGGKRGA